MKRLAFAGAAVAAKAGRGRLAAAVLASRVRRVTPSPFRGCAAPSLSRREREKTPMAAKGEGERHGFHTASDKDVNVKSRSRIGGSIMIVSPSSPFTRTGLPSSSMLLSMMTGLSLKRKFFSGYLISPFSI